MFFDLSKSLVLYFFLILNKVESTGPKTSICLITVSFFLISCAALKLSWLELDEIIKEISLEYGGKFLFFLIFYFDLKSQKNKSRKKKSEVLNQIFL